jgi:ATP dependent DNA ligase domain
VFLYAFDLIELNGADLRRDPLQVRKATLASVLAKTRPGIRFNEHLEGDGPTVFAHACKMGLEGIVSNRKDSAYRSGRSPDWLKMKNADALAVKREAEEDWERSACDERGAGKRPKPDHDLWPEERWHVHRGVQDSRGEELAISAPRNETAVLKHFQERMLYGLFVPDAPGNL